MLWWTLNRLDSACRTTLPSSDHMSKRVETSALSEFEGLRVRFREVPESSVRGYGWLVLSRVHPMYKKHSRIIPLRMVNGIQL